MFGRSYMILIGAIGCIETRMSFRSYFPYSVNRYIWRKKSVEFIRQQLTVNRIFRIKVCNHQFCMYPGIRSSGTDYLRFLAQQSGKTFHQSFLHTDSVWLYLPAMV